MTVLTAGVTHFPRSGACFLDARNDLAADRAMLVGGVDEIKKIGGDCQRQLGIGELRAGVVLRREGGHEALKLWQRCDAILQLPGPAIPIRFRNVAPKTPASGTKLLQLL